jgi:hypothetical protein
MDVYADYWPENFEGIASRVSDRLFADVEAVRAQVGSKLVADAEAEEIPGAQVIELNGGPCRDLGSTFMPKVMESDRPRSQNVFAFEDGNSTRSCPRWGICAGQSQGAQDPARPVISVARSRA